MKTPGWDAAAGLPLRTMRVRVALTATLAALVVGLMGSTAFPLFRRLNA